MKKIIGLFIGFCLMLVQAEFSFAQTEPLDTVSTVRVETEIMVDQRLAGVNILDLVSVGQTPTMERALRSHIISNADKKISGFRVRIYYDNKQTSRVESAEIVDAFHSRYRGIRAYRSYDNPYFKVTVGDCRTQSEALEILEKIKGTYPKSFIVKEFINYPSVQRKGVEIVDDIQDFSQEIVL